MKSRIIFLRILAILVGCTVITIALHEALAVPEGFSEYLFDTAFVALLASPLIYLWVIRAYRERKRAEEALRRKNEELATAEEELRSQLEELMASREALRESEERFRTLFENTTIGLYRTNPDGRILMANPALLRMLGYSSFEELAKRNLEENGYAPSYPRSDFRQRVEREGQVVGLESAWRRTDGSLLFVRESARAVRDQEGKVLYYEGTAEDVTERKQAEKALEKSERRLRLLAENVSDVIWTMDLSLKFTYISPSVTRLTGFSIKEALGLSVEETLAPASYEKAMRAFSEEMALESSGRADPARTRSLELEQRRKDGSTVAIEVKTTFLRDAQGRPSGILGVTRDISERKRLEAQVLHSQKMEAIGSLAGGVAHDFNNILMAIMSYSELLLIKLDGGPLREYAEGIQQSVEKAASLTQRLLAFSRREVTNPYVLALNGVVAEAEKMLRRLIGEDIKLVIRPAPDAGRVKADPGQLEQVIMNLAVNARDAMPQGGKLTIQTANVVLGEGDARLHPDGAPGRYVQLSVSDTGCGMDEATQARIFEPFFTTKEKGKGTGLGLSTVYGIVQQSGGFIELESAPGKGAKFNVYLPRIVEEAGSNPVCAVNTELARGSETVLLVEDEPEILNLVNEILSGQGYTVLQASTGSAALLLAERHAGPIHLLLTDVVMPGMSGRVLAQRLSAPRPDLKVLFMSGYTDDAILRHGLIVENLAFLQKPFRPEALLRKVREVLNAP